MAARSNMGREKDGQRRTPLRGTEQRSEKISLRRNSELIHEFLAFVRPAPGARLNFGKDLFVRRFHPVNLRSTLRRPRCGPSDHR
jgi:hypothetical protein